MDWEIRSSSTRTLKLIGLFGAIGVLLAAAGRTPRDASASNARWFAAFCFAAAFAGAIFFERIKITVDAQNKRLRQERTHWWGAKDVKNLLFRDIEAVRVIERRAKTGDGAVIGYMLSMDLAAGGLLRTGYFTADAGDIEALAGRLAAALDCPIARGGSWRGGQRLMAFFASVVVALGGALHAPTMWAEPSGPYLALTVFATILSAIEWTTHL